MDGAILAVPNLFVTRDQIDNFSMNQGVGVGRMVQSVMGCNGDQQKKLHSLASGSPSGCRSAVLGL